MLKGLTAHYVLPRKFHLITFRKLSTSSTTEEILFEMKNNVGIITLNRPNAVNVLTAPMLDGLHTKLLEWESHCSSVIIQATGDKAFCAGGDIVHFVKYRQAAQSFIRHLYIITHLIETYKKPYVAICNGITMGAGAGISVNGTYCVATEKMLFAMPENAVGYFPDIASSYFLPRLTGKLGLFLGLTGYRLKGVDVVKAGISTHYIHSEDIPRLIDELVKNEANSIERTLEKNTIDVSKSEFSLSPHLDTINSCFNGKTVEEIRELLEKDGSQFARSILELLSKMSPTSLKLTKKSFDLGASQDFRDCLIRDYRLGVAAIDCTISRDLYEGVRALLIDKDKKPKWNPAELNDINDEIVNKCFAPLSPSEELPI